MTLNLITMKHYSTPSTLMATRIINKVTQYSLTKLTSSTVNYGRYIPFKYERCRHVKNAIKTIISEAAKIDALVNIASYAVGGALEELSMEEIKSRLKINIFELIIVTQKAYIEQQICICIGRCISR
jgi:short-subunit dehydrogenase